ncbi:MAG: hypothetical protein ABEJ99_03705 [Candidatus Nanohaloarchaea archaeon]
MIYETSKGQINLEFLAAAAFYLIALGIIVAMNTQVLPHYSHEAGKASLNLEARSITNDMLSNPGRHDYGTGGTNWEENSSTIHDVTAFGLADDFMDVKRDKIMNLSTVGDDRFNYTQFKDVTGAKNQYRFSFTWYPTIQTYRSFQRGSPPNSPDITEPYDNTEAPYNLTDNIVHYGEITMQGRSYRFLVTARNGVYNGTYISSTWDFYNKEPVGPGDTFQLYDTNYTVARFQNRENQPGALLVLKKHLKTFGAHISQNSVVMKLNRYAVMDGEPLRIEVWSW